MILWQYPLLITIAELGRPPTVAWRDKANFLAGYVVKENALDREGKPTGRLAYYGNHTNAGAYRCTSRLGARETPFVPLPPTNSSFKLPHKTALLQTLQIDPCKSATTRSYTTSPSPTICRHASTTVYPKLFSHPSSLICTHNSIFTFTGRVHGMSVCSVD